MCSFWQNSANLQKGLQRKNTSAGPFQRALQVSRHLRAPGTGPRAGVKYPQNLASKWYNNFLEKLKNACLRGRKLCF